MFHKIVYALVIFDDIKENCKSKCKVCLKFCRGVDGNGAATKATFHKKITKLLKFICVAEFVY